MILASLGKPRDFFEKRKQADKNRGEVLKKSREVYKSQASCQSDSNCLKACEETVSSPSDIKDCQSLPPAQVRRLADMRKIFQDKRLDSFNQSAVFDLNVFLNLSPESVLALFSQLGMAASKELLAWILADYERASLFVEEDQDFIFLEALLKEIDFHPISALGEAIEDNMVFHEMALKKQNDQAMVWAHGFFSEKLCAGAGDLAACVLTQYCLAGSRFRSGGFSELLGFEGFRGVLAQKLGGSFDEKSLKKGESLAKSACAAD